MQSALHTNSRTLTHQYHLSPDPELLWEGVWGNKVGAGLKLQSWHRSRLMGGWKWIEEGGGNELKKEKAMNWRRKKLWMGKRKESKLHVPLCPTMSQAEHRTTVNPKWSTIVVHCSPMWYTLEQDSPFPRSDVHHHHFVTAKSADGGQGFHFLSNSL